MTPIGEQALKYARRGWRVFPLHEPVFGPDGDGAATGCTCQKAGCKSIGKHPRTSYGLKDATTDGDIIRRWWSRWPTANIGIVTGSASRLFVVDQDDGGELTMARVLERIGEFPETHVVRTGSGGRHWYFRLPDDVALPNTQGTDRHGIGPHVDTRGDGGYIVAPPSVHRSGGEYRWESDDELAVVPPALVDLLRSRATAPQRVDTLRAPAAAKSNEPDHDAYFVCHHDVVEGGNISRHNALRDLAFRLAIQGVKEETVHRLVQRANALHCLPPKDKDEVQRLVDSALLKEDIRAARAPPPEPQVDKKSIEGKAAIRAWKADLKNYGERTAAQALFATIPAFFSDMRLDPDRAVIEACWHGDKAAAPRVTLPIGGDMRELQLAAVKHGIGNLGMFAKRAHDDATEKLLLSVLQEMSVRIPRRDASGEQSLPVQLVRMLRSFEVWVALSQGDHHTAERRTTLTDAFLEVSLSIGYVVAGKQGLGIGLNTKTGQKVLAVNFDRLAASSGLSHPFRGMTSADLRDIFAAAPGAMAGLLKFRWLRNAADVRWYGVDLDAFDLATLPPTGGTDDTGSGSTPADGANDARGGVASGAENEIAAEGVPSVPTGHESLFPPENSTVFLGTLDRPHAVPTVPTRAHNGDGGDGGRPHDRPHSFTEKYRGFG